MDLLTSSFITVFSLLYSVLFQFFRKPVFATYSIIFLSVAFGSYRLFLYLRGGSVFKGPIKQKIKGGCLWSVQLYSWAFLVWYLFIHFKTYRMM